MLENFLEDCCDSQHVPTRERAARIEERFVARAAFDPDRPAIYYRGTTLTYGVLDRLSNRIAHRLTELGVGPGTLVALCMNRSPQMITAMLGILKAGGAYLPLDPAYPPERLTFMLADSGASIMLTNGATPVDMLFEGTVCDLDVERDTIERILDTPVRHNGSATDLAYVIYTSGSTGRPKGVRLAHSAIGLIDWLESEFDAASLARVAACTSISFDPSIIEIFGTLGVGGVVVLKQNALEPFEAGDSPTLLAAPPSVLTELARLRAIPDSVRIITVGGELVTAGLVRLLFESCAAEEIHNHYGPTEATTCATVSRITRSMTGDPTIGKPIAGARIHVLDEEGNSVEIGTTGEIYIAGDTVALGYVGDDTASRFLSSPFARGERMFRTGDLGKLRADGDLEFKGRFDTQVKLRGYRIELGEVEAALLRLPPIHQAAASIRADASGRDRLVAFVCADAEINPNMVRRQLSAWLPAHMIPCQIVRLDRLPLASTGKIDRTALSSAPCEERRATPGPYIHRSPTEEVIANVFARHLGQSHVSPDSDFFESGGDSLLAVEVALELEAILGKSVPPAMLAHDATPKALAMTIASAPSGYMSVLSQIQPAGERPPLFCTPDIYGRSFSYLSLARRLSPSQPVLGLSPGPHTPIFLDKPDVRALSRLYFDAIRSVQPVGPYTVTGYSFGAIQAFDLACLMEMEGETVLLILLDGAIAQRRPSLRFVARWLREATFNTICERGVIKTIKDVAASRAAWSRLITGSRERVTPHEIPFFVPQADRALAGALLQSVVDYRPHAFGGSCAFIQCRQPSPFLRLHSEDGWLGWRELLRGQTRRFTVDGDHTLMMREPLAANIDEIIQTEIAEFHLASRPADGV